MEPNVLIQTAGLYKKFSKNLRTSMVHGLQDWAGTFLPLSSPELSLRTGEFYAANDINLRLNAGEILAVVGVNGSGKTSLMRLISGIYQPDAGTIFRQPATKLTAIFALNVGMQALYTGRENIFLKGAMYGMSRREIEEKMAFIADFSELGDHLDHPFGNYSSGMRARLSYSIAMATEPDVFIIDESLAVGDSAFKAKCLDNLREFVAGPGKGVIFVSNQIRKVQKIADRILVMDKGRIVHENQDITAGLEYYIRNCYVHLGPEKQSMKMKKVKGYEL